MEILICNFSDAETGLQWPRTLSFLLFLSLSYFPSTKAFSFHDRSSSNFAVAVCTQTGDNIIHNSTVLDFHFLFNFSFYRAMHLSAYARSWDRMSSVCPSVRPSVCDVGGL